MVRAHRDAQGAFEEMPLRTFLEAGPVGVRLPGKIFYCTTMAGATLVLAHAAGQFGKQLHAVILFNRVSRAGADSVGHFGPRRGKRIDVLLRNLQVLSARQFQRSLICSVIYPAADRASGCRVEVL